ncbi:MAG: LTA synthase family protein [Lachnobacterium sp.]|nr:LTA synthase family protein [Lachnobacterium sp.]
MRSYIDWKEKNVAQDFEDAGTKESEMNEKDGPKSAIEDVKRWTRYLIGFAIVPIISFYLMEAFEHNALAEVRQEAQWFNILIFELIAWTLYLLIGRMTTALRIELALALAFGLTNHYVMAFRSTPFVPWDLLSVRTAASVAQNYDFTPTPRMIVVTVLFVLLMVAVRVLRKVPRIKLPIRLGSAVLCGLALCLFVNTLQQETFQNKHYLYPFLFTPAYMTKVNGMAVTFAMDLAYVAVDKPEGYSAEEAQKTLEQYGNTDNVFADDEENTNDSKNRGEDANNKDLPNIIVIMDEAFSDLAVVGDLETNEDYMPFMHKMQQGADHTITGYAQVSVCGGNTANSEFEFLTGNTMSFLPSGSIPYQQYITKDTPSLASYLASLGYETYAQHPYYASGWNREKVYPLLGFEHLNFIDDYANKTYVRKYVSDDADMQHIIDTYENKEDGKPAFIFNVTMQNHGGYTDAFSDLSEDVHATNYNSEVLDRYLSLIRLTDQSLEKLVDYFSNVDEKTVIVFFGDHQPSDTVAAQVQDSMLLPGESVPDEQLRKRYLVPYLVWANYDIDGATQQNTSLNYLSAEVLKAAGVPTDAYQNFLLDLQKSYPVMSAAGRTDASDADENMLNTYKKLQYYNLFETK